MVFSVVDDKSNRLVKEDDRMNALEMVELIVGTPTDAYQALVLYIVAGIIGVLTFVGCIMILYTAGSIIRAAVKTTMR